MDRGNTLFDRYRRCGVIGLTGGDWPGPAPVYQRLLLLMEKVRNLQPLAPADCKLLAWLFVIPNVVQWALHMRDSELATPYRTHCPVTRFPQPCREPAHLFEAPARLPRSDREEVCRTRGTKHPWALQITLLWNAAKRRRENVATGHVSREPGHDAARPSRFCAWETFSAIAPLTSAEDADAAPALPAPKDYRLVIEELWSQWASCVEEALGAAQRVSNAGELATRLTTDECYHLLETLVNKLAELLEHWKDRHLALSREMREQLERVTVAIVRPLDDCYRNHETFYTANSARAVAAFVALIQEWRLPGAAAIVEQFSQESLRRETQGHILDYIDEVVWPQRSAGIGGGTPLDLPVFQNLFWDWVGDQVRPDSGRQFELSQWVLKHWSPASRENANPKWRWS